MECLNTIDKDFLKELRWKAQLNASVIISEADIAVTFGAVEPIVRFNNTLLESFEKVAFSIATTECSIAWSLTLVCVWVWVCSELDKSGMITRWLEILSSSMPPSCDCILPTATSSKSQWNIQLVPSANLFQNVTPANFFETAVSRSI